MSAMQRRARPGPDGVIGARVMVASGHPLAVAAARRMLDAGGTAVDAAIAADAVLGVVEPMATGVGGDLLAMLVHPDGHAETYNGTGRAPAALDVPAIARMPGQRIPERHPFSVTTPGAVRGWHDLHGRFGRLPWPHLFEPAIAAATGFAVAPVAAREWAWFARVLRADATCARLYRADAVPGSGEHFENPELARTLSAIAAGGPDAFYFGEPAAAAARAVQAHGGVLATEDFAVHCGHFDTPRATLFRGIEFLETPPNTHGIAVLHALERLESEALDPADPASYLGAIEATRDAMRHARQVVADPAGNTVCTVVVDGDGLAITLMSSIFKRFGSGIAAPGCGFVLQNRGFGFSRPGHINGPAPGKRPYHTVVPAAMRKDGRFHACYGVVGGLMQPQGHVQLALRLAAWHEPLQAAIDAPRWRLESDSAVAVEAGMPAAITAAIRAAGYAEPAGLGELAGRSDFGGAQCVMRRADGRLAGGSDPRKDGLAWGE